MSFVRNCSNGIRALGVRRLNIRLLNTGEVAFRRLLNVTLALLIMGVPVGAAQFVEITAELNYTIFVDYGGGRSEREEFTRTVRCVIGTNGWYIVGGLYGNADGALLCTGSNVMGRTVMTSGFLPGRRIFTNDIPLQPAPGTVPVWQPAGWPAVANALGAGGPAWFAFCSGPYLKQKGRVVSLPYSGAFFPLLAESDDITVFNDGLGLPRAADLYGTNRVPVCHYEVMAATNFLGWNFPLRFRVRESGGPNRDPYVGLWEGAELVVEGRLTSIGAGHEPQLPTGPD